MKLKRRHFMKTLAAASLSQPISTSFAAEPDEALFKISLAEWSLHKKIRRGELQNLDFPAYAKKAFGINAVEYVNSLFETKKPSDTYLADLKKRCDDENVRSLLIMIDGAGAVGASNAKGRADMLEKHKIWLHAAATLGCHSVRVNASGAEQDWEKLSENCVLGLTSLCEEAKKLNLNVLVENHGGPSSNGKWLAKTLRAVNLPNCGSLPDFGNFTINKITGERYDRYQGMEDLMPLAKAVSAKSNSFDAEGNEKTIDYARVLKTVHKHGYRGYIGIEFEGSTLTEDEGILATKKLLERIREQLS